MHGPSRSPQGASSSQLGHDVLDETTPGPGACSSPVTGHWAARRQWFQLSSRSPPCSPSAGPSSSTPFLEWRLGLGQKSRPPAMPPGRTPRGPSVPAPETTRAGCESAAAEAAPEAASPGSAAATVCPAGTRQRQGRPPYWDRLPQKSLGVTEILVSISCRY